MNAPTATPPSTAEVSGDRFPRLSRSLATLVATVALYGCATGPRPIFSTDTIPPNTTLISAQTSEDLIAGGDALAPAERQSELGSAREPLFDYSSGSSPGGNAVESIEDLAARYSSFEDYFKSPERVEGLQAAIDDLTSRVLSIPDDSGFQVTYDRTSLETEQRVTVNVSGFDGSGNNIEFIIEGFKDDLSPIKIPDAVSGYSGFSPYSFNSFLTAAPGSEDQLSFAQVVLRNTFEAETFFLTRNDQAATFTYNGVDLELGAIDKKGAMGEPITDEDSSRDIGSALRNDALAVRAALGTVQRAEEAVVGQ